MIKEEASVAVVERIGSRGRGKGGIHVADGNTPILLT